MITRREILKGALLGSALDCKLVYSLKDFAISDDRR